MNLEANIQVGCISGSMTVEARAGQRFDRNKYLIDK